MGNHWLTLFAVVILSTVSGIRAQVDVHERGTSANAMREEMQAFIDNATDVTGFSYSVGYVDKSGREFAIASGPRTPPGLPVLAPGNVTGNDTMQMGSGTKTFTAAAVMRLVELGKVRLEDKASIHVDGPLKRMWNTTFVQLFGPLAANVTVGHLLRMQSGIKDFDIDAFDEQLFKNGSTVHSPFENIKIVADMSYPFMFPPGTNTAYSSENYILAGLILLAHAPKNRNSWRTYDLFEGVGLDSKMFKNIHFAPYGPANQNGLSVMGHVADDGEGGLYKQDTSILSWTAGYCMASAHDMAKFLFELLVAQTIVSPESVDIMRNTSTLSAGWKRNMFDYGAGLMVRAAGVKGHSTPPRPSEPGVYVGHQGYTYGFISNSGVFEHLGNASISVIVNQDVVSPQHTVLCRIVEIASRHLNAGDLDLGCASVLPPRYDCEMEHGEPKCVLRGPDGAYNKTRCAVIAKSGSCSSSRPVAKVPSSPHARPRTLFDHPGRLVVNLTDGGCIRGQRVNSTRVFRGIPYALAPVGDLRWRPPVPIAGPLRGRSRGSQCYNATFFRPTCIQPGSWRSVQGVSRASEDCLYVNVYAPWFPPPSPLVPVFVYIHAGEFQYGSSNDLENNFPFAPNNSVLVTFNYRLGAFGFLASDALRARARDNSTGNYGMQDQRLALEWVHANIESFGGDPARVVLFGESSGATSVAYHMVSPAVATRYQGAKLFSRAILESPGFSQVKTYDEATANSDYFLGRLAANMSLANCSFTPNFWVKHICSIRDATVEATVTSLAAAKSYCNALQGCVGFAFPETVTNDTTTNFTAHFGTQYRLERFERHAAACPRNVSTLMRGVDWNTEGAMHCLLATDSGTLLRVSDNVQFGDTLFTDQWAPAIDGVALPQAITASIAEEAWAVEDMEVIVGSNLDEGSTFLYGVPGLPCEANASAFERWAAALLNPAANVTEAMRLYTHLTLPTPHCSPEHNESDNWWLSAVRLTGDLSINCPVRSFAQRLAASKLRTYLYSFGHTPKYSYNEGASTLRRIGAFHGAEVPFVFHDTFELTTPGERALSSAMNCFWMNFGLTGDPNNSTGSGPQSPCARNHSATLVWRLFDEIDQNAMLLNITGDDEVQTVSFASSELMRRRCEFVRRSIS